MIGRPSRKGAEAVIRAHLAVLKGEPMRAAISGVLAGAPKLGGGERRFVAYATRELSRHMRLLELVARTVGHPLGALSLVEDQAVARYVLWRRVMTHERWTRIGPEVRLPGPVRPRAIPDAVLAELAEKPLPPLPLGDTALLRSATVHSFPSWLAEALARRTPEEELDELLSALNREPELIVRVRPPGTRDEVIAALGKEGVEAAALTLAPDAVRLGPGRAVFETKVMREGRLQVMDLGSQLIVELCAPAEGASVADVCAGAGGKTLALADRVGPKGSVAAVDVSRRRLDEARRRVREWGLRQVSFPRALDYHRADVVLIDAPCSGTGTLAREPDQKWRLTSAKVKELAALQGKLIDTAAAGMRGGAALIYATCSLLEEEDEAVVEAALARHRFLELEDACRFLPEEACQGPYLRLQPHRVPGGGFFAARLRKRH
ncbi:MAG: RsmB/NOP family class I SAM-dependent RNA methyltransferase [Myxococcota bacterium]